MRFEYKTITLIKMEILGNFEILVMTDEKYTFISIRAYFCTGYTKLKKMKRLVLNSFTVT